MIVCFPFAFDGMETQKQKDIAAVCIGMAKRFPRVRIIQMADEKTGELPGVDECVRRERTGFAEWYFHSLIEFPYQKFLKIEYDVVIRSLPDEVFRLDFDIAIPRERKGLINAGVTFVKNRAFWLDALTAYRERTNRDNWNAIQVATQMAVQSGKYKIERLDWNIYGRVPREPGDYPSETKLLHFKDIRKNWMLEEFRVESLG